MSSRNGYTIVKNRRKLNVERVTFLRDWLAKGGRQRVSPRGNLVTFYLDNWICVSFLSKRIKVCIGGAAQEFFGTGASYDLDGKPNNAGDLLGMSENAADTLFFPGQAVNGDGPDSIRDAYKVKPQAIADVLTHLLKHNEVDWSRAHG